MHPVIQIHQQEAPSPRRFEPLIPFHDNSKPEYSAASQEQPQHPQQQQQQQQHPQQQQQQQQQQQPHHQFLSQSRAAHPQSAPFAGAPNNVPEHSFPIRSSQPAGISTTHQTPRPSDQHTLGHNVQGNVHFAPAGSAVARNPAAYSHAAERLHEHQLRRKTPNGTIDAGYDGSHAGLATGPPPLKQMAMSASSGIFPTPVMVQDGTHMAPRGSGGVGIRNTTPASSNWLAMMTNNATPTNAAATANANANATANAANAANLANLANALPGDQASSMRAATADAVLAQQMQQSHQQRANTGFYNDGAHIVQPGVFSPSYQASPGPTAFNSPSFESQFFWAHGAFLQGYQPRPQPVLLPNMGVPGANMHGINMANNNGSLGHPGQVAQNIACDSAYISAAQPMFSPPGTNNDGVHHLLIPPAQQAAASEMFRPSFPQENRAAHSQNNGSNDIKMTSPNAPQPAVPVPDMLPQGLAVPGDSPTQFKERVLAHAEKTYGDLLYCLMQTKKSVNGRPLPNLRPRARPNVYSKPGQLPQQQQQQQQMEELQLRQSQAQAQAHAQAQIQAQVALATSGHLGSHVQQSMQSSGPGRNAQAQRLQQAMEKAYSFNNATGMHIMQAPLVVQAKSVLDVLSSLCEQSDWKWVEGMLLGACLYYSLENFEQALEWFKRIYALRPDFIEVLSNIAATLHCLDRREEAIKCWFHAVRTKPSYLESAEHLTTVLSSAQRHREAVDVIISVQNSLRLQKTETDSTPATGEESSSTTIKTEPVESNGNVSSPTSSSASINNDPPKDKPPSSPNSTGSQPGFGSSGYAIPAHDNGRMLGLIHMKANILYALKEIAAASEAYEEAVLISVGHPFHSIQVLIQEIRGALSTNTLTPNNTQTSFSRPSSGPPLLTPEVAKLTAARTFPHTGGQLPGLRYITDIFQMKAAVATASNALLSMAKILQDGMATSTYSSRSGSNQSTAVGDILSLYYLSMSLQESPSTANNVGILLASVQQSPAPKPPQVQAQAQAQVQGQSETMTQQQKLLVLYQTQQLQLRQQQQVQYHLELELKQQQQSTRPTLQRVQQIQKLQQMQRIQHMQLHSQIHKVRSGLDLKTGGAANGASVGMSAVPAGIIPGSGLALAFAYYNYGLKLDPKHVHLHTNLGSLLKDVGYLDLAIKMYEQAVACDGSFDIALTNLANAVKDRGRISEAIVYYRRAVLSNPDFTEAVCGLSTALNSVCDWAGRGGVVLYNGRYDRWHVDENGMLKDVRQSGFGSGLVQRVVNIVLRQLKEASVWGQGILHESQIAMLASEMTNAAGTTERLSSPAIAGSALATRDQPDGLDVAAELEKWAGKPWEGSRVLRLVERATRVVMRRWYHDRYIVGVESPKGYPRPRAPPGLSVPGAPTVLPFHTFTCPLPAKEVRLVSQRNALRISSSTLRSPWLSASVYPPPAPPKPHLNIGYISSDFNNHPLAHLMQSVFGFHDQTRAKAFCYATTTGDKSVHRQKIEREAPVFRDVANWAPERLIEQIIQDGIHILVNLNGYTRGARNEIFAARPAPIQMSLMGFAGTLGAEWCDYLLADTTAVPPSTLRPWRGNVSIGDVFRDEADVDEENWIYSENLIYSRDTFFCCDHKQSADQSERTLTWKDELQRRWRMRKELFPSLSDDTIILGNFNQLYKIDPTTFRSWLRILAGVPNAVLWLLRFPELGESNLRKTAALWASQSVADRIIFTDVAPKHLHITRARICDLFLDTPECNAHTTAADVLWSSTPLVTLPRYEYKMCSRIGASVLKGALPKDAQGRQAASELIAEDEDQYEKLAIKLASSLSYRLVKSDTSLTGETYGEGSGRLAEIRQLLWQHKWTCGLFDTKRWVSDLEDAYDAAWRNWVSGERGDIYL